MNILEHSVNAKILVVDDESDQQKLIRNILAKYCPGFQVVSLFSGEKCVEEARTQSPDVIILDVKLPGHDGFQLCRQLKEGRATKDIPVMLLSGVLTQSEDRSRGLEGGANAYLCKPYDPVELVAQVKSLLRLKQTQDELRERESVIKVALASQSGELKSSREQLHYIFEHSPDAIFIEDLKGNVLEANIAAGRLHGLSREELIGKNVLDLVPPEHREEVTREFPKWEKGGLRTLEGFSYTKDGRSTPVEIRSALIEYNDQPALLLHARDVTERKQREVEHERLTLAIEQVADSIIITDVDGTIEYVNPAFEYITGYEREEVIGQNPRILNSGEQDEAFYRNMWDTITRGDIWTGRFINKKKDGTLFTEEATLSPVRDASGKTSRYVGVMRDITRVIEVEDQLRQAQKMEAVGQLAGGVAHDFNNLLQVIMNFTDIVLDDLAPDDIHHADLEEVRAAALRACELTKRLLTFSRRQETRAEDLNLNEIIDNLLKMTRRLIGETVDLSFISGLGLGAVHADRGQMEQVVINLCINARDAMAKGGKLTIETENVLIDKIYMETHAWATRPGQYVRLSITDTGCGMDSKQAARIFDPFFTTKEVGKGTGLGLATVYGIVQEHKGYIRVDSEIDKGTTFSIYLPQIECEPKEEVDSTLNVTVGGTETILVAEDEPAVRKLAVRLLRDAGYTVLTAEDGQDAIRVFKDHASEIDFMLLDVVMPRMSGPDAMEQILKLRPNLPHLYASAYRSDEMHKHEIPRRQLIRKPYDRNALLVRVREILEADSAEE